MRKGPFGESCAHLTATEDAARGEKRKRPTSINQTKKKGIAKKDKQGNFDEDILRELSIALVGGPQMREGVVEATGTLNKGQCDRAEPPAPPATTDIQVHSQAASSGDAMVIEHGPANWVLPLELEGMKVNFENHNYEQVYKRIMVKCPNRLHARCMKKRNTGVDQIKKFGPIEPYAYLGLWLRKAWTDDYLEHKKNFEPSEDELATYIKEVFPGYIVK